MQIDAREDIAAPLEMVWAEITNFKGFERSAMRRGMDVTRLGDGGEGLGTAWAIEFQFRGRDRKARCQITDWEPPQRFHMLNVSGGVEALVDVDLVALSRRRTRLDVKIRLGAKTLPARLLVQSLKLARGSLDQKLKKRLTAFARAIEDRALQA